MKADLRATILGAVIAAGVAFTPAANATLVGLGDCIGANACIITDTPPNPVTQDPNDGILLAWDEVQNLTLLEDLLVDRVFDENASFVEQVTGGFLIKAGTVVSSHYLQWDPGTDSEGNVSSNRVQTTISLDSQVFAFITADGKLAASDSILGLPGLDYNTFGLRGLETQDTTVFNGPNVDIDWQASSPGDWTRLITAFSPAAVNVVPVPAALPLMLTALGLLGLAGRLRRKPA